MQTNSAARVTHQLPVHGTFASHNRCTKQLPGPDFQLKRKEMFLSSPLLVGKWKLVTPCPAAEAGLIAVMVTGSCPAVCAGDNSNKFTSTEGCRLHLPAPGEREGVSTRAGFHLWCWKHTVPGKPSFCSPWRWELLSACSGSGVCSSPVTNLGVCRRAAIEIKASAPPAVGMPLN